MTRKNTTAVTLLALAALLAVPALWAACSMHPHAPPELSADHSCCRLAQEDWDAAVAKLQPIPSAHSLYQIESIWESQTGESARLSQLAGRHQLVAMAYTSCEYACPRLLADLKAIEAKVADISPELLGISLVTFDPERDTPERFRAYAADKQLDPGRWTLLRSSPADILELANLLGVRYQENPNGEFSHSNIITLLSPTGEILARIDGLGADPQPLLDALKQ